MLRAVHVTPPSTERHTPLPSEPAQSVSAPTRINPVIAVGVAVESVHVHVARAGSLERITPLSIAAYAVPSGAKSIGRAIRSLPVSVHVVPLSVVR